MKSFVLLLSSVFVIAVTLDSEALDRWPVASPRPSLTSYGQYQRYEGHDGQLRAYLHSGLDILKPAGVYVIAVDSGLVTDIEGEYPNMTLFTGYTATDSGIGWAYSHIAPRLEFTDIGAPVNIGDTLGTIGNIMNPPHLHFARIWGYLSSRDVIPPGWAGGYSYANPLQYLPGVTDTVKPKIDTTKFYRDTTETSLPALRMTNDSTPILNHKIDIVPHTTDRMPDTTSDTTKVGLYKIHYKVEGPSIQSWKGYSFQGEVRWINWDPDSSLCRVLAYLLYRHGDEKSFDFICSNTRRDSAILVTVPDSIVGFWNTKKKAGGADTDTATQQSEAAFPDDRYKVLTWARDIYWNSTYDTTKVIVNNFPPQVEQSYPVDGSAGVPRSCTLKVWFDQPMDTVSAKAGFHLRLKNSTTDISGTKWFYSGLDTFMLFKPDSLLLADTTYLMKDSTSTKDIADSAMTSNHLVWFSTRNVYLHVSEGYYTAGVFDSSWIEVRDSLLHRQSPRERYGPDSLVWGQRITFDREGNRYVCGGSQSNSSRTRVIKYNPQGDSVGSYLNGIGVFGLTCDGDNLYAVRMAPVSGDSWPHYRIRVIKVTLSNGDTTSFSSPDSVKFWNVGYSPENTKLYLSALKVDPDGTGGYVARNLRVYRYTTGGSYDTYWNGEDYTPVNDPLLAVGQDRVYLGRNHNWYFPLTRSDSVAMFDMNLNLLTTIGAADSAPGGDKQMIYSLTGDKEHLYTLIRSYSTSNANNFYWVHEFTPSGSHIRTCSLSTQWETGHPFKTIAVYPSILGVTGTEPPPGGGGNTDGGPQTDNLNNRLPKVYALGQSYPNPANGALRIDYALPKESQVSLRVYNVMGQLVRTLREGKEKPGFYKAEWDGKDQQGKKVASGVYLYRMQAGEFAKTRKLVIVR